jgi:hypothetical protein
MNSLYTYLDSTQCNTNNDNRSSLFKLNDADKKKLLELDKEYGELVSMYRKDWNNKDVENMDEECKKFLDARKEGKKVLPSNKIGVS